MRRCPDDDNDALHIRCGNPPDYTVDTQLVTTLLFEPHLRPLYQSQWSSSQRKGQMITVPNQPSDIPIIVLQHLLAPGTHVLRVLLIGPLGDDASENPSATSAS